MLVQIVEPRVDLDRLAFIALRPQFFAESVRVALNEPIGSIQDGLRAVVLLEAHGGDIGKVFSKLMNIFNFRATPAVDGLIVIAHCHDLARLAREHPQPSVLDGIGVLKLIDQ